MKYITLELSQESMKYLFLVLFSIFSLTHAVYAKNDGGGSSGGSSGGSTGGSSGGSTGGASTGGNFSYSGSGYDSDLSKILRIIEDEKDYSSALTQLESYVYENPQNANGWNLIGFASRKLGKFDDAELYYNTGLEIDPNHDDILAYQGELYLQTDRYDKALENLAVLKDLCVFNCDEKKELEDAINKYEAENNL